MLRTMDKSFAVFNTFEDADAADDDYYATLAPSERLDILFDLVAAYRESLGEAASRFERVHRVVELTQS